MQDPKATPTGGVRERILETASRLFYQWGYRATGVNRIVEEADVAKASFYNHFPSKEDLAVACVERLHRSWMSDFRSAVEVHAEPRRRLAAVFDFLEGRAEEPDYRGCAFLNLASEFPEADAPVRDRIRRHKSAFRELLGRLQADLAAERGAATEDAPGETLYLLVEAALVESHVHDASWPIDRAREAAERLLEC